MSRRDREAELEVKVEWEEGVDNPDEESDWMEESGRSEGNLALRREEHEEDEEEERDYTMEEVEEEEEEEETTAGSGLIRIKGEEDEIFEPEDEVDCSYGSSSTKRQRKQEMNFITDIEEVLSEEEEGQGQYYNSRDYYEEPPTYTFPSQQVVVGRKRDQVPLYLLNPNDYAHDPSKQLQIRRAKITYRHHQEKKVQILRLTEENTKLREHMEVLKLKVLELSHCGCDKNKSANLEVLDVVIPQVPPGTYCRRKKSAASKAVPPTPPRVPPRAHPPPPPPSPPITLSSLLADSDPTRPFINISKSRYSSFRPIAPKPDPQKTPQHFGGARASTLSISGTTSNRQCFIPLTSLATIKSEPAPSTPLPWTARIKNEACTPPPTSATPPPPPVSRIVFANRGSPSQVMQTASASQILFGMRPATEPIRMPVFPSSSSSAFSPPKTASQLFFGSRNQRKTAAERESSGITSVTPAPGPAGNFFVTASGNLFEVVEPPCRVPGRQKRNGRNWRNGK